VTAKDTGGFASALPSGERPVRAAEVVGALSLATDLGTGQPLEHALRTAALAVRLGELAGASKQDLTDVYYVALLHSAGCTWDGPEAAFLYGDDISPRAGFALVDSGNLDEVVAFLTKVIGGGRPAPEREALLQEVLTAGLPPVQQTFATHCEVAQRFAGWLGFSTGTQVALGHVFERWDGHGLPGVTGGDELPLPARLLHVARDISVFLSARGAAAARGVIQRRSGAAYDPRLADLAVRHLDDLLAGIDETRIWEHALEAEPLPQIWIMGDRVDAAFTAMAAFTDLKSPWFREHSIGVADLAEAAAWRMGLTAGEVTRVRRAALAHDLGRVGVSNAIWEKPGPLGFGERERVRLHSHFTERAFAQSPELAPIGMLAGAHHERLDGSGYHRGAGGSALEPAARILAAAGCYQSMREARPYRPALDAEAAEAELLREAKDGWLDPEAVDAVLAAAGHRVVDRPRELPADLTERELDVLLILVRGQPNREIAQGLGISPKTVGHHVQHIYEKAGVRSRAAATVWAFEHGLIRSRRMN
jgi:HD-GYP domain-containing protein (c-di-GMP phosphodiesterase class II)